MKTGILTFHNANNYGAVLQAYALVEWLKQNKINAEIINYQSKVFDKYRLFRTQLYKKHPYLFGVDLIKCSKKWKRNKNFDSFRAKHLPVSKREYYCKEDLEQITSQNDFFICGSDQIWNPTLTYGVDPIYFLDFVKDTAKKISYAPSIACNNLTVFQKAKMVRYMSSFASLSIREQDAIDTLQPYCDKNIEKTCDPVFLPKRECFYNICSNKFEQKKYIFLYVVGRAKNYQKVISYATKKAKEEGFQLYYLIDGDKAFFHIEGKNIFGCKPEDFLSLIKSAQYVISNSFHATAFSILFEKQFITFLKDNSGSRMVNLLKDFNLSSRIFNDTDKQDVLKNKIDYTQLSQQLWDYRQKSEIFLSQALGLLKRVEEVNKETVYSRQKARKELFDYTDWRRNCYLTRHKCTNVVASSRSGGVFTALSDIVLQDHGVIYGCVLEDINKATHQRATTKEERDLFRGSKYIQSDMKDCYKQIKEDLRNDRTVLFSGTACQVAGLYGFLQSESTEKLYTIDIICHGVPSQKIWNEYLKWVEKKEKKKITSVNFRDKKYGWKAHLETIEMGNKEYTSSIYRVLFLKNAFLRPACYECPFSNIHRESDITIGDAWGIEKTHSKLNDNKGCSIVLVNTKKGDALFEKCKSDLDIEMADLENYLQPNLCEPSSKPQNRQQYWDTLENKGFDALACKYGKSGPIRRIRDYKLVLRDRLHHTGK